MRVGRLSAAAAASGRVSSKVSSRRRMSSASEVSGDGLVVDEELAVFEHAAAGLRDAVFLALGGGLPVSDGFAKFRFAAGELVVERGVEERVAGAGNQLGECGAAGGGIGEALGEGVVIGDERGAGEKQTDEGFSHVWNMSRSAGREKVKMSGVSIRR